MKKKILIVEDDFIIQMYLEHILSNMNCKVVATLESSNSIENVFKKEKIDLVLMDLGIRGHKDGVETAKFINKKHPTPIVFITGNSDNITKQRIKEAHPLSVIFKPIDELQLKAKLTMILKKIS